MCFLELLSLWRLETDIFNCFFFNKKYLMYNAIWGFIEFFLLYFFTFVVRPLSENRRSPVHFQSIANEFITFYLLSKIHWVYIDQLLVVHGKELKFSSNIYDYLSKICIKFYYNLENVIPPRKFWLSEPPFAVEAVGILVVAEAPGACGSACWAIEMKENNFTVNEKVDFRYIYHKTIAE